MTEGPRSDDEHDLGEELEPDVVEQVAERTAEVLEARLEVTEHRGQLPPPATLADYDERFPGLGREIVGWTSGQIRHRQKMEMTAVNGTITLAKRGQIFGFIIAFFGFVLILLDKELAGMVVLAPVIVAFVTGQVMSSRE
jgi:uncharacterized membrane protein